MAYQRKSDARKKFRELGYSESDLIIAEAIQQRSTIDGRFDRVYSPDIVREIIERVMSGETVTSITRDPHMPTHALICAWANGTRIPPTPDFPERYREARAIGYEVMADQLIDIADDKSQDWVIDEHGNKRFNSDHVLRASLKIKARQWILEKRVPSFNPRMVHELSQTPRVEDHRPTLDRFLAEWQPKPEET